MMSAQQVARTGVMVALLAVSAWVAVPLGPVPFTLQTLVLAMIPAVFNRAQSLVVIGCYLLMGAIGLPVFSGFQGGLGMIAGPTGGYLWGFAVGLFMAATVRDALPECLGSFARLLIADAVMLVVAYVCGTAQLMAVASLELVPALMLAVVPFLIPDAVKLAVGARVGCAVARALGRSAAPASER